MHGSAKARPNSTLEDNATRAPTLQAITWARLIRRGARELRYTGSGHSIKTRIYSSWRTISKVRLPGMNSGQPPRRLPVCIRPRTATEDG